ncbi:UNVERIFIED_CONTAM: hypothetical protein GTU68_007315, partial [Idotea baltica]|nr:hypothetical protein [Idotea baltica]
ILELREYEYFICQTVHIVNRRPIAFISALRDSSNDNIPEPITPECLIKGYKISSYNLFPGMQRVETADPDWQLDPVHTIKNQHQKFRKVKDNLIDLYHEEFIGKLVQQAVDRKDRYKPKEHKLLSIGDLVLLNEFHCKPFNYPMGRVKEIVFNDINKVTGAIFFRGDTKELVKRHSSTLIPLLTVEEFQYSDNSDP